MPTRTYRPVPVGTLASGTGLFLPVHEIRGEAPGPTVGISAGIHGEEATGVEIVCRFLETADLRGLAGRLLVMPVANPLSYAAVSRGTPIDMMNLNRVFPGHAGGHLTEQMAHKIVEEFLRPLDVYIDLHAGGSTPTVDYVYIINAEPLSRAFGSSLLYRPRDPLPGTSISVTRDLGIRSVVVELGGGRVDQSAYVARGIAGLLNILRTLGVLPGPATPPPPQIVLREIVTLRPHHGGLLLPEVTDLGGEVRGGQVLGRVVSPYSLEELEVIRCPVDRGVVVLTHLVPSVVEPGIFGFMIGNLATAQT
ncbi:MAG: succinylglutamate desuccinylase/aspartoacylase family protein [Armatimonadota bacterium]|nr:succinylglutamate desuccinylase/aspartoacylase family protein [Armatimonadota bacterium]MDR7493792.1 succinylglutamate desuccinylase/aspartoacylase family protein [Armatimonadota bacterium]MDR7499047.1 succinylglutamate desuccinylase/aspartoacylase family protein [Armatimonadota bacterium]MDR7505784.1 succinylglutamate desuccinylase/aspartoacylase family protein [Armatimonadota bacterium]MDR7546186.1 succinylglutamate desuccinylase/aspartoacylase family protein [Armatimonadota bacterium]